MMKFVFISFVVAALTISCSADDTEPTTIPDSKKWDLVQMTGQTPNSTTTGNDMEWQEFYLLDGEARFTKHRERGGVITKHREYMRS